MTGCYHEKVGVSLDGELLDRPLTAFSAAEA
jgi:hypothetical protein